MPYASPLLRVTALFDIVNSDERASFGLHFASSAYTAAPVPLPDENLENILQIWQAFIGNGNLGAATYGRIIGAKSAAIGTDGHYLSDPTLITDTPVPGSKQGVPAQATTVCSLRSGSTLGKGNYGRIYWPYSLPAQTNDTPYLTTAVHSALADNFATMLGAVEAEVEDATIGNPVLVIASKVGAGLNKRVAQVAVGRVTDTQRRRRNALTENYEVRNLPA